MYGNLYLVGVIHELPLPTHSHPFWLLLSFSIEPKRFGSGCKPEPAFSSIKDTLKINKKQSQKLNCT